LHTVTAPASRHHVRIAPPSYRIIFMSLWSVLLTLVGLAAGGRAVVATVVTRSAPWWFAAAVLLAGLISITLTILTLGTVRYRVLPWLFLLGATTGMAVVLMLTISAL
jgi:hypothetical protein